ncbi:hypothetical protein A4G18_06510 [Pasteurellaceae bacterium Pebbles2]|nr:hypothetical protein [Pasteurellaceae bacterium Pebbles2]
MIVGNGMMAKAFAQWQQDEQHLIFASGVSNSQEIDRTLFERESQLLERTIHQHQDKQIVYFSTCSLYDPEAQNTPYAYHKLNIEQKLQQLAPHFLIVRLPQVVGKTASPTLIHFLYQKILHQQPFELWRDSFRNLLDVADVVQVINHLLCKKLFTNQIVNVASTQFTPIKEIVAILEDITQQKAQYQEIDKGCLYPINIELIAPILKQLGIEFDANYARKTIKKYYQNL